MDIEDKNKYAGFWKRTVAMIIDQIVIMLARAIIATIIYLIIYGIMNLVKIEKPVQALIWMIAAGAGFLANLWGVWLYFASMESSESQGTLGKMALGIKVTDTNGEKVTFEKATARHFSKFFSFATILIGFFMTGFSSRKQALHDIITRCMVVDKYWS